MSRLSNLTSLPKIFLYTYCAFRKQQIFIKNNLEPYLDEFQKIQNQSLSATDLKKITFYYGCAVPAVLGEGFSILTGQPLSKNERISLTYLGALTGLYDDFFDKFNTETDHIYTLTINPDEKITTTFHELLFVKFYQIALKHCPSPNLLKKNFIAVFNAQLLSKKQAAGNLSAEEIETITRTKGGASLLFYRSALGEITDKTEENLIFTLGGLGQLENDIFDIYKDYQENILTLATTTKKISELRKIYIALHADLISILALTNYEKSNKVTFMHFVNLIVVRGLVCLDFLEQNEKQTHHIFSIQDYERKQLICDLEKFKNTIKILKYFINSKTAISI